MDIAALSMALSQGNIKQHASIMVMQQMKGSLEQQGEAIRDLLQTTNVSASQRAAQPHIGGNIDMKA